MDKPLLRQGRVIIHLDSVKYENFAAGQLKTSPAVHQKVMDSFKNLIAAGYPAETHYHNGASGPPRCYETLRETLQFSYDLGVRFFNLIPLSTLGRSDDLEQSQYINKQELRRAFDVRREILGLDFVDGLGICEYCKQFQLTDFTIAWNGNVYPYIDYYVSAGNVMSGEDIGDILRRNADMMRLAEWVSDDSLANNIRGHCGICEYAAYCFGNPVSKPVVKPGEPDHHCWLVED